jgi:hypothetical protein
MLFCVVYEDDLQCGHRNIEFEVNDPLAASASIPSVPISGHGVLSNNKIMSQRKTDIWPSSERMSLGHPQIDRYK